MRFRQAKSLSFSKIKSRNYGFLRARAEIQGAQLLKAPDQKSKLRLKCGAAFPFIKWPQKGIVLGFHHPLGVEALGQHLRQRALADSNRTFHCNVAGQIKKIGHGQGKRSFAWQDIPAEPSLQLKEELTGNRRLRIFNCLVGFSMCSAAEPWESSAIS